jgi:N-acetylneuraminic acid mutarotase
MKNLSYRLLLTILFIALVHRSVVAVSSDSKELKLGLSSNVEVDNAIDEDLAKAWPEVKSNSNSIVDVPSVDAVDQSIMRFAQVAKPKRNARGKKSNNPKVHIVDKKLKIAIDNQDSTGYRWDKIRYKGAPPAKREGHTSVAVEDYIITFGGCYLDKRCFNDLHVFNTHTEDWVQPKVDGMAPIEREGHTATMVGQLMYVYGGSSQVGYLDDVYALNVNPGVPGSGEELPMAWGHIDVSGEQPAGREGHSAVQYGNRIIYFGGYTEKGFSNEVLVLDTALNSWQIPSVGGVKPSGREGHTALLYKDRMYVFGGFTNGGCLNDLYILDLKTMTWEVGVTSGKAPSMREDHTAILRGHEMLTVGGCNFGKGKCFCDLNILNLKNLAWREEKTKGIVDDLVVTPREDHTMTMVRGKAYLFGGCYLAQKCYNDVFKLEPSTGAMICGNNQCSGHGSCREYANREKLPNASKTYACACSPGYAGDDCSLIAACPGDCSGHGMCKSNYQCACNNGWTKNDCSLNVKCPGIMKPNPASALSTVLKSDPSSVTLFVEVNNKNISEIFVPCSGNGECRMDGHCQCYENWFGNDCSKNRICPNDCSGHGVCAGPDKAAAIKKAMILVAAVEDATKSVKGNKTVFLEMKEQNSPANANGSLNVNNAATKVVPSSKVVFCHCNEGFSDIDCSRPTERIIPMEISLSLSMRHMGRSQLMLYLQQGWGTHLLVAISNFIGVPPERMKLQLENLNSASNNSNSSLLLELRTTIKRRLGGRSAALKSNTLLPTKTMKKKNSNNNKIKNDTEIENRIDAKDDAIVITVKIKCRGKMQLEAVEEQLKLRHAAGVLEIFFEKQLPTSASKPYIHLLKSSISGLFKSRTYIKVPGFKTGKRNKNGTFNPKRTGQTAEGKGDGSDGDNEFNLDGDKPAGKPVNKKVRKTASISQSSGLFSSITSSISKFLPKSNKHVAPPHATCSSECSKHGICHTGKCYCFQGYQGNACTVTSRKEFLKAEQALVNNGIFKWATGSFVVGFGVVIGLYPIYKRILNEKNRKQQLHSGPMVTAFKKRYR